MRVSTADYGLLLDRAEADLLKLGRCLDREVPSAMYDMSLLLLAHRARTLFTGVLRLIQSEASAACVALIRPAVEINLTLRFIVANPALHSLMWVAEGERQTAKLAREIEADHELSARLGAEPLGPEFYASLDDFVEDVRVDAIASGVVGVSKKPRGLIWPSTRTIAVEHGDLASREAYTMAFRSLSQFTHGSARAYRVAGFRVDGDRVSFDDAQAFDAGAQRIHRALNITTFASTLCIVSEPLELDVLDEARLLKDLLVTTSIDDEA